jgi:hypothetical protein
MIEGVTMPYDLGPMFAAKSKPFQWVADPENIIEVLTRGPKR